MIILRMVKGRRCLGCSATRRVDARTGLCTDCVGLAVEVADRKVKLNATMQQKFARSRLNVSLVEAPTHLQAPAWWGKSVRDVKDKLAEFNSLGRTT